MRNMMPIKCEWCENEFYRFPSKSNRKFCSKGCYHNSIRGVSRPKSNRISFNCDFCNKKVETILSKYRKAKKHFCSDSCHVNWKKKHSNKISVHCKACRKSLLVTAGRKNSVKYCSMNCYSSIKGRDHHNWKGGKIQKGYPVEFNEDLKLFIRARDGWCCKECSYSQEELDNTLEVHHIDYNKMNNSCDNLISLCKSCHAQTGFKRVDWQNYFKKKLRV